MPTDPIAPYLEVFRPDFVFSITFFIAFIGFGVFFSRQFWPWIQKYLDKKIEYDYQISTQRWEVLRALSDDLGVMKKDFSGFLENERKILDILSIKRS